MEYFDYIYIYIYILNVHETLICFEERYIYLNVQGITAVWCLNASFHPVHTTSKMWSVVHGSSSNADFTFIRILLSIFEQFFSLHNCCLRKNETMWEIITAIDIWLGVIAMSITKLQCILSIWLEYYNSTYKLGVIRI